MPAVTADPLTVPRLVEAGADVVQRPVRSLTSAPSALEGEGFPVRRAFAGVALRDLDPFVHMDQMGEVDYAPGEPRGTDWHPHRGFETVTYMLDGTLVHQDSNGGGGTISDGATQWMTAGAGILHIETPPEALVVSGGLFHGIQLWVNLPANRKMVDPRYQDLDADQVVLAGSADGGALVRLIAGELGGRRGPGETYSPITMVHVTLAPGARVALPWPEDFNALIYGLAGQGEVGSGRTALRTGDLAVLGAGGAVVLANPASLEVDVLVLGGRPIGEPVAAHGPFVMNTRAELARAMEDFRAGRLGTVPAGGLRPYRRAER